MLPLSKFSKSLLGKLMGIACANTESQSGLGDILETPPRKTEQCVLYNVSPEMCDRVETRNDVKGGDIHVKT